MMMRNTYHLAAVLLLLTFVGAQTETVVNNAGVTVVELVTLVGGLPATQILQTLAGTQTLNTLATSTAATSTRSLAQTTTAVLAQTTTTQQLGAVEQPASLGTAGGETPYEYTTTNADGSPVVMQGVFTPTSPSTILPSPTTTGTILGYSQWLSLIGTYTAPPNAAHRVSTSVTSAWYYLAATALAGLAGGAWLIIP